MQARYIYNSREEDAANSIDRQSSNESGFEIRRMKLTFDGNVFNTNTKYKFQWATNRANGNLILEEAFASHKFLDAPDFGVKVGQHKDTAFHEEILSSKRQLAVERSLANEYLAGGVAQVGYMLTDKVEAFGRYSIVAIDGDDDEDDDQYHEITGGVNYFFSGHAVKLTLDAVYLPNGVPNDQNGLGELDPDADVDQVVFRGQFQLLL